MLSELAQEAQIPPTIGRNDVMTDTHDTFTP